VAKKSVELFGTSFDISYEILNSKEKQDLIVLHGWGSNKALMKQSLGNTLKNYRHIYIDLPGFGNSTTQIELNTQMYAQIIEKFLELTDVQKDIILGHSFGGKVATLLKPKLLVLVGSSGILLPKPLTIRLKISLNSIFKKLGLGYFRRFFIADDAKNLPQHMYETFKTVVNEDFSPDFKNYRGKTLLFWGKEDSATPLRAAKMIEEQIADSKLFLYDGDHYFFMKRANEITKEIENYIQ